MVWMNRRHFLRLIAAGAGGTILAACGGGESAGTEPPADDTPTTGSPAPSGSPEAGTPDSATPTAGASASAWKPERPVTLICPWAAGGGTDAVGRMVGTLLEEKFGQPVNTVNRTGGGGAVGHSAGATADPDGHTITIVTVEIAMMHWMGLTEVSVDDFAPVAQVNFDPAGVQVRADAEWNTVQELLDAVKASPGEYNASGTGRGGIWDVARAGMLKEAGIPVDAMPWVPSEGAAPALQELAAGGIDVVTASLPEGAALIESGKVKALAIMAEERSSQFPDVPTLKESGIDWIMGAWRGFGLPKGTDAEIVAAYEAALAEIVEAQAFTDFMSERGFGIKWRNAEEFGAFMTEQDETMGQLMKEIGLTS